MLYKTPSSNWYSNLLPKNRGNVLATSEGSVANYGGNKKMGFTQMLV